MIKVPAYQTFWHKRDLIENDLKLRNKSLEVMITQKKCVIKIKNN